MLRVRLARYGNIHTADSSVLRGNIGSLCPRRNDPMRMLACSLILLLPALTAVPASAASPYPPSITITGINWDVSSYRWGGTGGDIWPITWSAEGPLVGSWGDGQLSCTLKASYGVAAIASALPSTDLSVRHCGPTPHGKGKMMALIDAGGVLYTRFNPQDGRAGFPVWKSTDGGQTWSKPAAALPFLIDSFVQFGQGNAGAPDGYVYALENRGTAINLLRVPAGSVQTSAAYQYFSGTDLAPAWSAKRSAAKAIFRDPAGIVRPTITHVPLLGRYLLTVGHALNGAPAGNKLGIFEAPSPWGPWSTVSYVDDFLQIRGGNFLGMHFPIKWQTGDGTTLWAIFSCHNKGVAGACGQYHDRLNLLQATLTLAPGG